LQTHNNRSTPCAGENRTGDAVVQSREIPALSGVARIEELPHMRSRFNLTLALASALVIVAACGGGQATTAPASQAAPATQAASAAPMSDAPASAAAEATVLAEEVGDAGTIIIDGESRLTLYYFEMDEKDSGVSNCKEGCLAVWPALTVEEGETPTGGEGVDATKLGTIVRDDNGETQVTYDGLPLYFFAEDTQPGDLKGVYPQWVTVAP
jgi:predicted lipoprotein with Yx(FWY)xxD motif